MNNSAMCDFVKGESHVTQLERDYSKWLASVNKSLGYSANDDLAFSLFDDGCTVEDAVAEIKVN
ncbi:hypothetical protein KW882_02295 [Vibrio parahaemolyticus]